MSEQRKKYSGPIVKSYDEQLTRWVSGESVHVAARGNLEDTECCPDFSCCRPQLLQPVEVRRAFVAADSGKRNEFLMAFLGGLFSNAAPDVSVHITDGKVRTES